MGMLTYIPPALASASNLIPNGNLPVIKDGFIIDDPHYAEGMSIFGQWLVDGFIFVGKSIIGFIVTNGVELDQVFVVVAICGIFVIMAGFRKLGTKLTSGSILGYIACKVVSEVCK